MALSPEIEGIRAELEQRRRRALASIAALAARPEIGSAQGFGKRIGDGTVEAISRITEIGVGESLESTLEHIERALARIGEGTYGVCESCGEPIQPARLRAMPDRTLCIDCAGVATRRPAPRRR